MLTPDDIKELVIDSHYKRMLDADNRDDRVFHMGKMCSLIKQRSPQQVARMEAEKGIL